LLDDDDAENLFRQSACAWRPKENKTQSDRRKYGQGKAKTGIKKSSGDACTLLSRA